MAMELTKEEAIQKIQDLEAQVKALQESDEAKTVEIEALKSEIKNIKEKAEESDWW